VNHEDHEGHEEEMNIKIYSLKKPFFQGAHVQASAKLMKLSFVMILFCSSDENEE